MFESGPEHVNNTCVCVQVEANIKQAVSKSLWMIMDVSHNARSSV